MEQDKAVLNYQVKLNLLEELDDEQKKELKWFLDKFLGELLAEVYIDAKFVNDEIINKNGSFDDVKQIIDEVENGKMDVSGQQTVAFHLAVKAMVLVCQLGKERDPDFYKHK